MSPSRVAFTGVRIKTSFIGFHRWPDAPPSVHYLAQPHRHQFGVEVSVIVDHNDRAVEFHTLRREIDDYLLRKLAARYCPPLEDTMTKSCEMMAKEIGDHLADQGYNVGWVAVDEDGENTGYVIYEGYSR